MFKVCATITSLLTSIIEGCMLWVAEMGAPVFVPLNALILILTSGLTAPQCQSEEEAWELGCVGPIFMQLEGMMPLPATRCQSYRKPSKGTAIYRT